MLRLHRISTSTSRLSHLFALILSIMIGMGESSLTPSSVAVSGGLDPLSVIKRLPVAIIHTSKASIESFLQTAGVMVPAGLIWKLGSLKTSGMKPWLMDGGRLIIAIKLYLALSHSLLKYEYLSISSMNHFSEWELNGEDSAHYTP